MAETKKRLDERTIGRIPVAQYFASSSTGNDSYAITLDPVPTAYETGREYEFKADVANTGAASLNVNGLGAKTIKKLGNLDLNDNDILAGQVVRCQYDGTNMQMVSQVSGGIPVSQTYASSTTGNDTYAITLSPAPTAYEIGRTYMFKADVANTGAASLNVNGLGAKTIKKNSSSDLSDNDILAGAIISCVYDGTNMQIVGGIAGYSIFVTGTAGEALSINNLVYLKSSDNKWYKGVDGTDSWNVSHIVYTGAALNGTAVLVPLNGRIPLATPLTANTTYYRKADGTLDTVPGTMDSSSHIPMSIGSTDASGNFVARVQRIARRKFLNQAIPTNANFTVTVGFKISYVKCYCTVYDSSNASWQRATGFYDAISGTQVSNGFNSANSLIAFYWLGSSYVIAFTASINGSNDLVMTWAGNNMTSGVNVVFEIVEQI